MRPEHRRAAGKFCSQAKLTSFACTRAFRGVHAAISKPQVMGTTLPLSPSTPTSKLLLHRRASLLEGEGLRGGPAAFSTSVGGAGAGKIALGPHKVLPRAPTCLCRGGRGGAAGELGAEFTTSPVSHSLFSCSDLSSFFLSRKARFAGRWYMQTCPYLCSVCFH